MLFAKNIGPSLSIDETALSNGELYTVLTSKDAKGGRGAIVAMIKGTEAEKVIKVINKIPIRWRNKVKEITLDMAGSMNKIAKHCFHKATKVIDRFHVQKLAFDALQEMRINHRWQAIDDENDAIQEAKLGGVKYVAKRFENGDTPKQLLARSRYLLFKSPNNWSPSQALRAEILFREYPDLKQAFSLTHKLRMIYSKIKDKGVAYTKLAHWYKEVEESGFRSFNTIAASIHTHYEGILSYFDNRSTNASAESFNAKLKAFRATQRGVRDLNFFLFRVAKIYA
jgi:transposase